MFFIRSNWVQTKVGKSLAQYYAYELDTDVTIDNVKINGVEYAELRGLFIADQHGDTLLYVPYIDGKLSDLSLDSKYAIISGINSEGSRLKIQKYKGEDELNLKFLIDYFKSDSKEPSDFSMIVEEINLNKTHLSFDNWNKEVKEYGMDYEHIDMRDVTGKIIGLKNRGEVTTLEINGLGLKDRSGFQLDSLNAFILIDSTQINLEDLRINTPNSNVVTNGISFKYESFEAFSNFVDKVELRALFENSILDIKDLSYFVTDLKEINYPIELSGNVSGPISDIVLNDFYLGLSGQTYFDGSIALKGLPEINKAEFDLNINVLQTSKEDLDAIDFTSFGLNKSLDIPEQIGTLGTVFLMGYSNGNFKDFDISLDVITDIGVTTGSFKCEIDTTSEFYYNGVLSTAGMDLGTLLNSKTFGNFTSDLNIYGKGLTINDLDVEVEGHMNKFDLNQYTYDEVKVNGHLKEKSFEGLLVIQDQNIDLNFEGEIDINKAPYQFSFEAEIIKANPYDLHLINTRESASACFNVMAEGNASDLDDFTGLVYITDVAYFERGKDYNFESIMFESKGNTNYHTIDVFSEFANVTMEGEFNLDSLDKSLYSLGAKIFPSLFTDTEKMMYSHEVFDLSLDIQDLSKLSELFFPELTVSPNTNIHCDYNSDKDELELFAKSDWLEFNNLRFAGIQLDTTQKISSFGLFYMLDLKIDSLFITKDNYLQNVNLIGKAYNDNIGTSLYWSADDSSYWGKIYGDGYLMGKSKFEFDVHPSEIYSKVGLWHIDKDAHIKVDSTSINLDKIIAKNYDQLIKLNGVVSELPEDKLNFEIAGFNLNNLAAFTDGEGIELDGALNLDGYVSDLYNNWYFDAYTLVEYLSINGYYTGNIEASTSWNSDQKRMELLGELIRFGPDGDRTDFVISKGHYYIGKPHDNLDFKFDFKNTDLTFANAFMPDGLLLEGNTKGSVFMRGNTEHPEFSGSLFLNNTAVTMEMLNVKYTANGQILIEPDMVLLNGIPIKDKYGAEAFLVGSFFHQNFKQYSYDFFATFDNPFLVMNTTYKMNPLYYGDAFVSGDLSINYENILDININAKSEKGTNITLPLYGSEDVVLKDFVSFVNNAAVEEEYKVDLEGINLNLSMDLTEEAEIQLVFDEVVGDVMKGTGNGHIDMYIDQFYDFYMFGNYEITEGSYLFTLKDFINKKFQVKPGSNISWYGDPYSADIDIKAYYPLKASLYDIMSENDREGYKQKADVECIMHLTQNLFNPNIGFDILLPRSDENAKSVLRNLVSSEQEMNKQVFSLLILNKFLPRSDVGTTDANRVGFVEATTSEVLSNQLSNMISNFSDDFDIGFNYRPGDEISNDEVAIAMSTQLFNDKLTVKTNVGVSHENESTAGGGSNSLIGDVDVEYKLNPPEGNLRVHAFNESNEYDITKVDQSKYTQGIGMFYQESFDNGGELFCKLANLFRFGNNDCKECQEKETREACKIARKEKSPAKKSDKVKVNQ